MNAEPTVQSAVKAVLNELAASYSNRDIKRLLEGFAPDLDVVMFGTGVDERRTGLAEIRIQAERDWSQTDASAFNFGEIAVSAAGSVAWAASDCAFQVEVGGQRMTLPGRFTGVLEKRGDKWLVVQSHFSLPAMGQDEGSSFPN